MERHDDGFEKYSLENGLVVAKQRIPSGLINAELRANYGACNEKEGEEGLAHYLEHCLVTAGTEKHSSSDLERIIPSLGYYNAQTNIGRISFLGRFLPEDFENWLSLVSQQAFHPTFDQERVEGERKRVLRELVEMGTNHHGPLAREYSRVIYREHPLGKFVLGKEDVIKNANVEALQNFYQRGFHPNNFDLILAGNLPKNDSELINHYFGNEKPGENTRRTFPPLSELPFKTVIRAPAKELLNNFSPEESAADILLSVVVPPEEHPDRCALHTIATFLGKGPFSQFYKKFGLESGLSYCTSCNYASSYNTGIFEVTAAVPAKRIDEGVDTLFQAFESLKKEGISEDSLNSIRKNTRYALASTFDSSEGHLKAIKILLDSGLTPEQYLEGYNQLTSQQVQEASRNYLPNKDNGRYFLLIKDPLMD